VIAISEPLAPARAWLGRLRPRRTDDVPERVRRAIAAAQARSEVLISWVQLAVVLTFAALYALSPKTAPMMSPFHPVPWVLAGYLVFTLLRLSLAYRRALRPWLLALSVLVDMALLMALIWSFHIQYAQPPAFYLKVPTLLYVFIFIALRTLRSDATYVVLAGVVAALGWLGMLAYAIAFDPGGIPPITRDYVHYITSASILIGGEFDKVVSMLMVTGILAVAITRARRTLRVAVTEGAAASELKRFFAPDIARRITGGDDLVRPGEGELRDAAALFVDLRGFTTLSRGMPPNAVVALLAEYQARLMPVIQRHGGSIDKFLGDGILASFGAARASESYAADALRAVDALLEEADAWRAALIAARRAAPHVGAAVAHGPVLFGAVGDASRLEYTVIGDAVNLAAKLEKHTKVAKVRALTTAETYRLAMAQGYAMPKIRLKAEKIDGVESRRDLIALG
jgi:adenylate cyclase